MNAVDGVLAHLLWQIEENNTNYEVRERLIYRALYLAQRAGHQIGFRFDPTEPQWPVAYIKLPEGQVSWHMLQFPEEWDGHDTVEKYRRARAFCQRQLGTPAGTA